MTAAIAALLTACPRPDGHDAPEVPELEETLVPAPYGLYDCSATCASAAMLLLADIAAELNRRGRETQLTADRELFIGETLVARVVRRHPLGGAERVQVTAAQVFDD